MTEVIKPAGAWGWTTIGAKNPKNAEALKAAGMTATETKKKEEKKENKNKSSKTKKDK